MPFRSITDLPVLSNYKTSREVSMNSVQQISVLFRFTLIHDLGNLKFIFKLKISITHFQLKVKLLKTFNL